jgi:hypothetical protein
MAYAGERFNISIKFAMCLIEQQLQHAEVVPSWG